LALIVQKFGGSSVADVQRIRNVARLVIKEVEKGNQVVVTVSAMGKTTDNLLKMVREITDDPPAREVDMLLATGEQISIAALAICLDSMGHKAVSFTGPQVGIKTDKFHGRARIVHINDARIRNALDGGKVVTVAGFQGVTSDDEITTLGRGGSDTTAVALAAALKADRCDIYTDVDGVFTTDPRIVPEARRLDTITYGEMLELASMGAKVLHGRSVELAMNYKVPLRVLSSLEPGPGTMVMEAYENMEDFIVSGVTLDRTESKLSIIGVPDKPGMAARIFTGLGNANVSVDMIIQNVGSDGVNDISFTVDNEDFKRAKKLAEELCQEIGATAVQSEEGIGKLSVVGVGMKSHSGVAGRIFAALAARGINIKMVSTSEICVACLIDLARGEEAVKAIHDEFRLGAKPAPVTV
jgi:aspartate kinase